MDPSYNHLHTVCRCPVVHAMSSFLRLVQPKSNEGPRILKAKELSKLPTTEGLRQITRKELTTMLKVPETLENTIELL